jgi:cytochrome b561
MRIKNGIHHYGILSISLHWLMAILIIGMLGLALYMTGLPNSLFKLKLYGTHKEVGVCILMLVSLRLLWRLINIAPALPLNLHWLEKLGAHAIHYALYFAMFAMPLSGWLMSSSSGYPVSFFGLFTLPDLVSANQAHKHFFEFLHQWIGYCLIAAIVAHVAAALKHHFINKDNLLRRMLWP